MQSAAVPSWMTADELARWCGVAHRTARRWVSTGYMPAHFRLALALRFDGHLGLIHPDWSGWSIRGGELHSPDGWRCKPGDVLAIPIRTQHVRALESAVARLQAHIRDIGQLPLFAAEPLLGIHTGQIVR